MLTEISITGMGFIIELPQCILLLAKNANSSGSQAET
jgi:hypothetical protein